MKISLSNRALAALSEDDPELVEVPLSLGPKDREILANLQQEADSLPANPQAERVVEEVRAMAEGREPSHENHLTTEQAIALMRDYPYAFLTGVAGAGKSYTVDRYKEAYPNDLLAMATTGIAAVNISCATVNSTLGFFDLYSLEQAYMDGKLERKFRKIYEQGYRTLLIDEVSMLSGEKLDILMIALKEFNKGLESRGIPSLRLILTGDMCLGIGTKIMMADGSIKCVEDIKVNDEVMGPDSQPRKVLRTCRGHDQMYLVSQTNGDDYVVNSKHKIVLKRGIDGSRPESWGVRYPHIADDYICEAKGLVNASRKFRECFVGYKAGLIWFKEQSIEIDPYFLGAWLGDGDSGALRITTSDQEVKDYLAEFAQIWGLEIYQTSWAYRTDAVRIGLTSRKRRINGVRNPLWQKFKALNVINNKHIPDCYLYNSEINRLKLLAGLLDTDGCWSGSRYSFANVNERLARQVKQLADQLGFRAAIRENKADHCTKGIVWTVTVGGDTWRIPCKIARKISFPRNLERNRLTSVIKVTPLGIGEYAGFETDGDHLFLLADGTVTHNCQLPPVLKGAEKKWIFEAEQWKEFAEREIRLTKVYRQSNPLLLDALNAIRRGEGKLASELLKSSGIEFASSLSTNFSGTTIVAKNEKVDAVNNVMLLGLQGRKVEFTSRRWKQVKKNFSEWEYIPETLSLKIGAYVMILANDHEQGYVNGDCGELLDLEKPQGYDSEGAWVKLARNNREVFVTPKVRDQFDGECPWGITGEVQRISTEGKSVYFSELDLSRPVMDKKRYLVGQVEYMPLRAGYAATCHKTQGLSLDRIQVDVRDSFFGSPAMVYVALSRCKSLEGIRIVGSPELLANRVKVEPRVRDSYDNINRRNSLSCLNGQKDQTSPQQQARHWNHRSSGDIRLGRE